MTPTGKIQRRRREIRERLLAISRIEGDDYNDTIVAEERAAQDELLTLRPRRARKPRGSPRRRKPRSARRSRRRAAPRAWTPRPASAIELRSKAMLTNYLSAAARGRMVDGAEAELSAAAGIRGIPLELWDVAVEQRQGEQPSDHPGAPEQSASTSIRSAPEIFANSIATAALDRHATSRERHFRDRDDHRIAERGGEAEIARRGGRRRSAWPGRSPESQSAAAKPKSPDAAAPAVGRGRGVDRYDRDPQAHQRPA